MSETVLKFVMDKARELSSKAQESCDNEAKDEFKKSSLLDSNDRFKFVVNTRDFEEAVTNAAKSCELDDTDISAIKREILSNLEKDKPYAFVLYFILFSWLRRNHCQSLTEFYAECGVHFNEYVIDAHIRGMMVIYTSSDPKVIKKSINEIGKLIKQKSKYHDFSHHGGVLNLYSELICKYFESQIDERDEPENAELLKDALSIINQVISDDEKKKSSGVAYQKFYLIKGRALILLKRYSEGEDNIRKAISLVPLTDKDRANVVNDYSRYLVNSSMIRAFDLNAEKFGELEKFKVESYKSITLIMAVVGFLLGGINIFAKVENTKTLLLLLLGYCGLVVVLAGTVLLGFSLNFKNKSRKALIFDVSMILAGLALFAVPLCLIVFEVV